MKVMDPGIKRSDIGERAHGAEDAGTIEQVNSGMQVRSSDGVRLGTIVEVWCGEVGLSRTGQLDEETCSRLEVRRRGGAPLYIPCNAVAGVLGKCVTLNVNAQTATSNGWGHRPKWVPSDEGQTTTAFRRRVQRAMATSLQRS